MTHHAEADSSLPPSSSICRGCGELQPAASWEQVPPVQRYCGVCGTPACDDDTLDRLQSQHLDQPTTRLYGTSLVSPTPEVVAFMAGWDIASKGAADQALVPFDLWVNRAHTRMLDQRACAGCCGARLNGSYAVLRRKDNWQIFTVAAYSH